MNDAVENEALADMENWLFLQMKGIRLKQNISEKRWNYLIVDDMSCWWFMNPFLGTFM